MTRARPAVPAPNLRRAPLSRRLATAWTRYVDTLAEHGVESAHLWRLEVARDGSVWTIVDAVGAASRQRLARSTTDAADRLERQTRSLA